MRNFGIFSLAIAGTLLALGCGMNGSPTSAHSTTEAAKVKRDEYAREISKQLDEFDVKCKELEVRITKAEGQAKKDLEKKLEKAKGKRTVAAKKLDELKEAGADRWEKVKDGVGNVFEDLKKVFE